MSSDHDFEGSFDVPLCARVTSYGTEKDTMKHAGKYHTPPALEGRKESNWPLRVQVIEQYARDIFMPNVLFHTLRGYANNTYVSLATIKNDKPCQ